MEIGPLLIEQRRIADKFRAAEKALQEAHGLLAERHLDRATREQISAGMPAQTAELLHLGQRRLELDASVTVAASRTSYLDDDTGSHRRPANWTD